MLLASIFKSEAIPEAERLNVDTVVTELKAQGKPARQLATADEIVDSIVGELKSGDVVAILSNGGFGGIYEKLPALVEILKRQRR